MPQMTRAPHSVSFTQTMHRRYSGVPRTAMDMSTAAVPMGMTVTISQAM